MWNASFAGTFSYHDHAGGSEGESGGLTAGLVGALVVHPPDDKPDAFNAVVLMDTADDAGTITDGEFRAASCTR